MSRPILCASLAILAVVAMPVAVTMAMFRVVHAIVVLLAIIINAL